MNNTMLKQLFMFTRTDSGRSCSRLKWATRSNLISAPSGFAIEGPSQAKIECEDQNDGSCNVCYWPTEPGEYAVHVTCDEEDIEHSPFMAHIVPDSNTSDADKVSSSRWL